MLNIEDKISLSTCCCSNLFHNGYQMLEYIANLGFKNVELSHGIRTEHIPGILEAVEDKIINVSSVHNFCPLPPGINFSSPNLFKPIWFVIKVIIQIKK